MKYPQFWLNATPRRKRIYSIIFVFVLAVLSTIIGLLIPVNQQEAQLISQQLNQTVTQGQAHGTLIPDIFINNFSLCLLMFIPLVGFGIGMFILFSTGQAFRAVFEIQAASSVASSSTVSSLTPTTAILALILIGVVFLLEYVSYTIGMAESIWLFRRLLQWLGAVDSPPEKARPAKSIMKKEIKYLLFFIALVAVLLIVGAVVETFTISIGG